MSKAKLFLVIILFFFAIPCPTLASNKHSIYISVSSSPHAPRISTWKVTDNARLAKEILRAPTKKTKAQPEFPRATIRIGKRTYVYDSLARMFEPAKKRRILLSTAAQNALSAYVDHVEQQHYGQLLAWQAVRQHFSRMAYADVIDLETGERFRVQRRAGSRHADVQPLTRQDTDTMKRIYQGKWSWRRRAILVLVNGKSYAASMHGMPHGAGAIANNGFPGHFCIHFAGSTTHTRSEPDPSHSLMIMKAAGKLPMQFMAAEPHQLVDWFLTALHEHDESIWGQMMPDNPLPVDPANLEAFKLDSKEVPIGDVSLLTASIPVKVRYHEKGKREQTETWCFYLTRSSQVERWKITDIVVAD